MCLSKICIIVEVSGQLRYMIVFFFVFSKVEVLWNDSHFQLAWLVDT